MPPPYQVFISFKQTDDKGQETRDSLLARAIHDHLTARGLRVFFAPVSLEGLGRSDFSQAIDDALEQAQVLLVVGTREENIKSPWVSSEWRFFINAVNGGRKPSGQIFTYVENIPIHALPPLLSTFTRFEHKDGQGLEKLWGYVRGALNLSETPPQAVPELSLLPVRARPAARPPTDEMILDLGSVPMTFVRVPAGEFRMGSDKTKDKVAFSGESPQHRVHLDEYWIGRYPVTAAQFAAFVKASGYKTTAEIEGSGFVGDGARWKDVKGAYWGKPSGVFDRKISDGDRHPVTQVSWEDAAAFCAWASQQSGRAIRLPSEAEWEKAARGTDGRLYPWGNEPPEDRCNFDMKIAMTTPVGRYSPAGDSPYGCADMSGNVMEWCQDWFDAHYFQVSPADNPPGPSAGSTRCLRGGSWSSEARYMRCASRLAGSPKERYADRGFRVVLHI